MDTIWAKALQLALQSLKTGDVPVGAVIVKDNRIIGTGYNNREKNQNVLGHAEINAIIKAQKKIKNWNLSDCSLYVTLKPCSMCEEVIKQARIKDVFYLLDKPKNKMEYNRTIFEKMSSSKYEKEYCEILSNFFAKLRAKNK